MIENNTEKRYKTQKTKLKMSADARKNLSRVRVVQRNLVYIMGLPSHLADESVSTLGLLSKPLSISVNFLYYMDREFSLENFHSGNVL